MRNLQFKNYGGTERITVSTNSTSKITVIPQQVCDWVSYKINPSSIEFTVKQNSMYEDRKCDLKIVDGHGNGDYIKVTQDGYRNMLVDLSQYVIIPYNHYIDSKYYELPIRIYGGHGEFVTDKTIVDRIKPVYEESGLYNDYIFYIDETINGTFKFIHSDKDEYIRYCEENKFPYRKEDLEKEIVIKNISKETIDGYTIFEYEGKEYFDKLPPVIQINHAKPTVVDIKYNCYFDSNLNFVENSDYDIKVEGNWIKSIFDKEKKKIYLKASGTNTLSDRRALLRVKNVNNRKQSYSTIVLQRTNRIKLKVQ